MQSTLKRLWARRQEQDGEKGFTLIELLIVIVVLGILAAIVVFAVQNLTGQSAQSACGADYKTVETAAETYKGQMGVYPGTLSALTATGVDPGGHTDGPWLKELPTSTHYTIGQDAALNVTVTAGGSTSGTGTPPLTPSAVCALAK
jgi:general secretion pathway protein G